MSLLDYKCATPGCWHFTMSGIVYCVCCYHGRCDDFTEEQKAEYKALKALEEGTEGRGA